MLDFIVDEIDEILVDFDDKLMIEDNKDRLKCIQNYLMTREVFLVHSNISEESKWIVFAKNEEHAIELILRQNPDIKREWLYPEVHIPIDDPDEEI